MNSLGTVSIETDRLLLRRACLDDAEVMFDNWANSERVCRFLAWNPHGSIDVTRQVLARWVADYEDKNNYHWIIELKEISRAIGSISAVSFSEKHRRCEVGYCIGERFWGKGIVAEALTALIDFFFDEIGLVRVQACHDVSNAASGRVMEKAGMRLEGLLRKYIMRRDGVLADCNMWAVIKADKEEQ